VHLLGTGVAQDACGGTEGPSRRHHIIDHQDAAGHTARRDEMRAPEAILAIEAELGWTATTLQEMPERPVEAPRHRSGKERSLVVAPPPSVRRSRGDPADGIDVCRSVVSHGDSKSRGKPVRPPELERTH